MISVQIATTTQPWLRDRDCIGIRHGSQHKSSKRIVVRDVEYRWRATGNDGFISVTIWPVTDTGPQIVCRFGYHETMVPVDRNRYVLNGDQVIVTNRIVRRIIEYAIDRENYIPDQQGPQLTVYAIEDKIDWSGAVRASDVD